MKITIEGISKSSIFCSLSANLDVIAGK